MAKSSGEYRVVYLCECDGRVIATTIVFFEWTGDGEMRSLVRPRFTVAPGAKPHHVMVQYPWGWLEWLDWEGGG